MKNALTIFGAMLVFLGVRYIKTSRGPEMVPPVQKTEENSYVKIPSIAPLRARRSERKPNPDCTRAMQVVRIEDPDLIPERLQTILISSGDFSIQRSYPAELDFLPSRLRLMTARTALTVLNLFVTDGEEVLSGDALLEAESRELADAQSAWLKAQRALEVQKESLFREEELLKSSVGNQRDLSQARRDFIQTQLNLEIAGQKLAWFGYQKEEYEELEKRRTVDARFVLRAASPGRVHSLEVVVGTHVEEGHNLLKIADSSRLRARIWVPVGQADSFHKGQRFVVQSQNRQTEGRITAVPSFLDSHTRQIAVWGEFENQDFLAGEFVTAELQEELKNRVAVPLGAIQWDGCCNLVFEKIGEGEFQPHKVVLYERGDYKQVVSGLQEGMEIVTDGAFVLKSILMQSEMGDACCG